MPPLLLLAALWQPNRRQDQFEALLCFLRPLFSPTEWPNISLCVQSGKKCATQLSVVELFLACAAVVRQDPLAAESLCQESRLYTLCQDLTFSNFILKSSFQPIFLNLGTIVWTILDEFSENFRRGRGHFRSKKIWCGFFGNFGGVKTMNFRKKGGGHANPNEFRCKFSGLPKKAQHSFPKIKIK